jgi:hypothetical protein
MAARKKPSTEVANYDDELAKYAQQSSTLTGEKGGGRFFSTSAGVLQFDDVPLPGNEMVCVVAAHCLENVYYEDDYDPQSISAPTCFAFCKDPDLINEFGPPEDMADGFEAQNDTCKGCWANEFGSASKGKGKACSNRRRLALLPAGRMEKGEAMVEDDPDYFRTAEEAYLKVPVMSGKVFDSYLREVATQFEKPLPLFAVYTRVYLTPDPKSQFKINFEFLGKAPDELIPVLMERHRKLHEEIDFPYRPVEEEEEQPKARASAKKKLTSKGGSRARK